MATHNDVHRFVQKGTNTSSSTERGRSYSFNGTSFTQEAANGGADRQANASDICRMDGYAWVRNVTQSYLQKLDFSTCNVATNYTSSVGIPKWVDDRGIVFCRELSASATTFKTITRADNVTTRSTSGIAAGYYIKSLCHEAGTDQVYLLCAGVTSGNTANYKLYKCHWTGGAVTTVLSSAGNGSTFNSGYAAIAPRYGGGCYLSFGIAGSGLLKAVQANGTVDWSWTTSETYYAVPSINGHYIWVGTTTGLSYTKSFVKINASNGSFVLSEPSKNHAGAAFKCCAPAEILQSAPFTNPYTPKYMIGGGFSGSNYPDLQGFMEDGTGSVVAEGSVNLISAQSHVAGNGVGEAIALRARTHASRASKYFRGGKFYYAKKVYHRDIRHCPS